MKFYQAEMEALDFAGGHHTLKEWVDFGYNKVNYNDKSYWDGLVDGQYKIPEEDLKKVLEADYYDYDEDGYMFIDLKEVKEQ